MNHPTITITGPVGIGKSVLLARIRQMLAEEFGAVTKAPELDAELKLVDLYSPAPHEVQAISNTVWVLKEVCETR